MIKKIIVLIIRKIVIIAKCIIATAGTFQDALAASPYAYWSKTPVFLANGQTGLLDEETVAAVKQAGFTSAVIAGGEYWISEDVRGQLASAGVPSEAIERRSGATAYETSTSLASAASGTSSWRRSPRRSWRQGWL